MRLGELLPPEVSSRAETSARTAVAGAPASTRALSDVQSGREPPAVRGQPTSPPTPFQNLVCLGLDVVDVWWLI